MSLTASLKLLVSAQLTGTLDLAAQRATQDVAYLQSYSDGAGADQADVIFSDRRNLAASANEDLDLVGALTNLLGGSASMARIKAVIIKALPTNTNNVQVTRPASNGAPLFMAAGDGISLAPGDVFAWFSPTAAGKALTGGSADLLNIENSAGSTGVDYEITVLGAAT